jgi:hypothetical protein
MNKFEKLIEYVINDEENKAADLFHQIVVDKSRDIYEDLMQADKIDDEDVEDVEKEVEADEINEDDDEMTFGGDDGEADEIAFGGDEDFGDEEEGEFDIEMGAPEGDVDSEDLEDRVVDLEDKLDELMAEFDDLMGDEEGGEEFSDAEFSDELSLDDEEGEEFGDEEFSDELSLDDEEEFEESTNPGFFEGAALKPAPKPTTSEEGSINKKSTNANNAGGKGRTNGAKPVKAGSAEEKGRGKVSVGSLTTANTEAKPLQKVSKGISKKKGDSVKSIAKQNNK